MKRITTLSVVTISSLALCVSAGRACDCGATGAAPVRAKTAKGKTTKAKPTISAQRRTVIIDVGYEPNIVQVQAGKPVALTFIRKEQHGCGNVVKIPTLGIKRTLKTGAQTTITFTPQKSGTVRFTCGMDMYEGQVVVK